MESCMILDPRADPIVIEQPDSIYAENTEYKCRRCGQSFSSPYVTRTVEDICPFDNRD